MGFGKGAITIPFLKQLTLSDKKMIQKLCSMPLYDIRGQLYEYRIYETFDYERNSVYDNTLSGSHLGGCL